VDVTWHSFDLKSGRRGAPVDVDSLGVLKRLIGTATETQLAVLCYDVSRETHPLGLPTTAGEVPGWDEATLPGRTMLVALDANEDILWGGMVLRRRSTAAEWVACTVFTLEHYFERRFVGDVDFTDQDLATVAAGLIDEQDVDGLDFTVDAIPTGSTAEEALFSDSSDVTIASALERIGGLEGGCEWTVDLSWADATHTRLVRTARVAARLGTARPLTTQWTLPGPVLDFEFVEDYSREFGANDVLATSSGEGGERPSSQHKVDTALIAGGWPRYELRFSPGPNIVDDEALDQHADTELAATRLGLSQLKLTADLTDAPRLGTDWWLGDDITAVLTCSRFPARTGPDGDLVPGYTRRLRAVGVEINLQDMTVTPSTREIEGGS
jgi:hypothetical protein